MEGIHPNSNKWITQNCHSKYYLNENNRSLIETDRQKTYWNRNTCASKKKGDYKEILWPQSNTILNKKDYKLNNVQTFLFRNRRGNLSLNSKLNNLQQFYINRPIKTFSQARFRKLHHTNKCEVCLTHTETFEHFAGKCTQYPQFENTLIQETDIIIYESLIELDKEANLQKPQHLNQPSKINPNGKRKCPHPLPINKKRKKPNKTYIQDNKARKLTLLKENFYKTNQCLIETPVWYINSKTSNKFDYRGSQGYITKSMIQNIKR